MAIIPIKYQALSLQSMQEGTFNTGTNLIQNGKFDSDLSNWSPANFIWEAGTAKYEYDEGCYLGLIEQEVTLEVGTRYKFRYKYKATNTFDIALTIRDSSDASDIVPEQIIQAETNGNWHIVTVFINCMADVNAIIRLTCTSTGNGEYGDCNDTGNAESGCWFDDISLYEQTKSYSCGTCDEVIMDLNRPLDFQVKLDPSGLENLLGFPGNPYDLITSSDFEFDLVFPVKEQLQLYIEDKIYIIEWKYSGSGSYTYTQVDNVYFVIVSSAGIGDDAASRSRFLDFLNEVIDVNHGTTSSLSSPTFTIANMPAGSYLNNAFGYIGNISTVTATTNIGKCFYYKDGNLYYKRITNGAAAVALQVTENLTTGKTYRFAFNINSDYTDFTAAIKIDDGTNPVQTIPSVINYGNGSVDVLFDTILTSAHNIRLEVTDAGDHFDGLIIDLDSMLLTSYTKEDFIDKIEAKDCQGNITELPYNSNMYKNKMLIQINNSDFPAFSPITIIVTDVDGNIFISQNVRLIDFDTYASCKRDKLLKLNWKNSCKFGDIDYQNLPFENEMYLHGFIRKSALDKKDRIQFTDANSGASNTIFNRSAAKAELRTALYSPDTHATLERVFEHNILMINDKNYYLDDSGNYTINPIGNGYYNARVDLVESGSEMINTTSCC